MANERNPNDPYRSPDDAYRANPADEELRRAARTDNQLQRDPDLAEDRGSGSKIAMLAVAIALVLGVAFYAMNNSTTNQAGTTPAASTAQNAPSSPPAAPPGMRDVTPRANDQGVTTGAAPARPQTPPSSAPAGQDMNTPTTGAPSK